jgi:Pentapeptide repeats (8 copies)
MASVQGWVALVGGLATAILGILKYFNYRTRTDRLTLVGHTFSETVDALAAKDEIKRLAAAILLRRFFDPHTEQGSGRTPYQKEALRVIAALLRATKQESEFQKLLADGLGHAPDLHGADLQGCNLSGAYLGDRLGRPVDISGADLYKANLSRASLRGAIAKETVFYGATLANTVLEGADLTASLPGLPESERCDSRRLVHVVRPRGRACRHPRLRGAQRRWPARLARPGETPARS